MAQNYVQQGASMPWTNDTGSTVLSGAVVVVGSLVGVALGLIADTLTGMIGLDGVWTLPKEAALAIDQGELVYWDASAEAITKTSEGNTLAGAAFAAALAADDTVLVKLQPAITVSTFVPEDSYITWTNGTGSTVDAGDVVVAGSLVGVADADIANGDDGTVTIAGIATLPKNTSLAIDQGDVVYWDAGDGELNKTSSDNTRAGIAVAGALAAAATVDIKLNV